MLAFIGYAIFRRLLIAENRWRERVVDEWSSAEVEREALLGDVPLPGRENILLASIKSSSTLAALLQWAEFDGSRCGDEKITFKYGL